MPEIFATVCGIAAIIFLLYRYLTSNFDFWKIRGVNGPKPILFFGNIKDVIFRRKSMTEFLMEMYNRYKNEPFIGVFLRNSPILILKDPQLIKDITIKDFSYFPQRGMNVAEKAQPLSQHLLILKAELWRPLRKKLSPAFSSTKLKEMFPLILKSADHFEEYLNKIPENDIVEFRELTAKYTIDTISCCTLGMDIDTFCDEKRKFHEITKQYLRPDLKGTINFHIKESFPRLYNNFGFLFENGEASKVFTETFTRIMNYRKKNRIFKNDVLNILMELKENPHKLGEDIELTDSLLIAQIFIFFSAGYETSSSTMSNAFYELAQHQDIQDRLRKEIREEYKKNGGSLTAESVKTMPYLDAVYQETLRKHPVGQLLFRQSLAPYTFQGTKVTIPKHQDIVIPLIALHHDSSIFPNPEVFDPERFTNEAKFDEMYYMPFGRGPRNCIGERFAVYQTKVGLIAFLRNHKVEVCEKTEIPYTIDPAAFLLAPKGGIHLKISKISDQ